MRLNKLGKLIQNDHLLPGSLIELNFSVSKATLRRWEKKGWIRDAGTAESSRLSWIVLTTKGYQEA